MTSEDNAAVRPEELDLEKAFADITSTLARDGYAAEWETDDHGAVRFRVVATEDACADCLVPPVVMESILSSALEGTGFTIASVELPRAADAH
jgi:hypothetical protein